MHICFKKENIHGLRNIITFGINYSKHTKSIKLSKYPNQFLVAKQAT